MNTKTHTFFFENQLFTFQQFAQAMANPLPTCRVMLNQHIKRGNVVRIKQGLYASIPLGANAKRYPIDPYIIIRMLAPDALIAYHSALQFHGLAYSLHFQYVFQSMKKIRDFQFRQDRFQVTKYSQSLPQNKHFIFTDEIDHHGFNIRVTQLERTFVDVLDRINLRGGLEEVWRSLANIQKANIENICTYTLLLGNATTTAKVGFYLRLRQHEWAVDEHYFVGLKKHLPLSIHYLDRENRRKGKYIKEWRIVVPNELIQKRWEEILDMGDI